MCIKASVLVIISIVMTSCAAAATSYDVKAARAIVSGPMDRLYEFDQNLQTLVGSNFAKAGIKCDECGTLSPTGSHLVMGTMTYTFYRDTKRLKAFIKSWNKVQTTNLDNFIKITFDTSYGTGDCSIFKSPCRAAPFCNATPGCDPDGRPPCTACQR